ncbi:MAG TPA: M14 metallopeptidase family protein [Geothrix sp.]|nr:M14 metallopeptidase family protein [Geothrix sp.]
MRRVLPAALAVCLAAAPAMAEAPNPSQFLKLPVGADRTLADYAQITSYFHALAAASPRVQVENLGRTTNGQPLIMAVISSEANLRNKAKHQEIARKLADPRGLTEAQIEALAKEGKAIVLVTCSIHASEIGASQMAMEWAHGLATAQDAETRRRLDNVILLLMPSLNPDGQVMETEYYRKQLGTRYEGGRLPWLYHPYVGHDNNRDWYMLTQKESLAVNRMAYHQWFPQVWLDEHQMGATGPRMFVPPYANPVAAEVHPLVWRTVDLLGSAMSLRLEEAGKAGVAYGTMFDAYWPGGTKNTGWWKNVVGLLTEVASARLASPAHIDATELSAGGKGLVEYKPQVNFPNPWKGGAWRLRDIMDYERIASDALLESCANLKSDLLRNRARMAQASIQAGDPALFYRLPLTQRDPVAAARLAHLMAENGAEVRVAGDGSYLLPTAQPLGRFVKEMLEPQRYPETRPAAGAAPMAPYDVAAWTLPMMMGVQVEKTQLSETQRSATHLLKAGDWPKGGITGNGAVAVLDRRSTAAAGLLNEALKSGQASVALEAFEAEGKRFEAGSVLLKAGSGLDGLAARHHVALRTLSGKPAVKQAALKAPRVGLLKPWAVSMDEGWTRWILEQHGFAPRSLEPKAVQAGKLHEAFDVIVLPDVAKGLLLEGRRTEGDARRFMEEAPPEYSGGLGKEGVKALKAFVEQGGTLVALSASSEFLIDELGLPVRNTLSGGRGGEAFACPGSILHMRFDGAHPVAYGMAAEGFGFMDGRLAFQTLPASPQNRRAVIASYPDDARDILASGWIKGPEQLERKAAAVSVELGKGKVVLFGFRVQHRAQTEETFKLLFNALYWSAMGD